MSGPAIVFDLLYADANGLDARYPRWSPAGNDLAFDLGTSPADNRVVKIETGGGRLRTLAQGSSRM